MSVSAGDDRPGRLSDILDLLAGAPDLVMRGEMLADLAAGFHEVPSDVARRPFPLEHRVPSCESDAYVWAVLEPGATLRLHFAVENPSGISAKALAAILDRALSGLPPDEVARIDPGVVADIFRANISMGKGIGLMSLVQAVRTAARQASAYLATGDPLPRTFPRVA